MTRLDSFIQRQVSATAQRETHANPGERFLYSVCAGDLLSLNIPGADEAAVVVVRRLDGDGSRLWIQSSNESRASEGLARITANGSTSLRSLGAWKIEVTADGQVRSSGE